MGGWGHNDLTPANILVSEADTPVLIDFGRYQMFGTKLIGGAKEDYTTLEVLTANKQGMV